MLEVWEEAALRWQHLVNKRFANEEQIASNWLQELVYNSSTDSLSSTVSQHYNKLSPTSTTYSVRCSSCQDREVEESMISSLGLFKCRGVA